MICAFCFQQDEGWRHLTRTQKSGIPLSKQVYHICGLLRDFFVCFLPAWKFT